MKKIVRKLGIKKIILYSVELLMVLVAIGSFIGIHALSELLPSQLAAERWQGTSDKKYAQVSCFLTLDGKVSKNQIGSFREAMAKKLKEAALTIDNTDVLTSDAWSCVNKVSVQSSLGSGTVQATAVGGNYFDFHPITLLSGNYITDSDLMQDRALLDEDTAWLLFGSTDIQGLTFKINGATFTVAGVIEREQDFASKLAYKDGMGIFISYDAWEDLVNGTGIAENVVTAESSDTSSSSSSGTSSSSNGSHGGIQCYEVVMAEAVTGFAKNVVKDKFPIGQGEIVCNSTRYTYSNLWSLLKSSGTRSIISHGVMYPYWENAARVVEDRAVLLLAVAILSLILPGVTGLVHIIKYAIIGKRKLADELIPRWKDRAEEAIRSRERRQWLRHHVVRRRRGSNYGDEDEIGMSAPAEPTGNPDNTPDNTPDESDESNTDEHESEDVAENKNNKKSAESFDSLFDDDDD